MSAPPRLKAPWATVVADPPWAFEDKGRRGGTKKHYATAPADRIARMPVGDYVLPDANLYLWAPNALVLDGTAQRVCRAWGFEPYNLLTWVKTGNGLVIGTGRRFRNSTEQCIYAVRGRPLALARNLPTHYYWPRGEHSEKPPEFYRNVVERMSVGPYLELFARYARPGWAVWGNGVIAATNYAPLPQLSLALVEDERAPYRCLGCGKDYAYNPDPDAYNCPACGEKLAPAAQVGAWGGAA